MKTKQDDCYPTPREAIRFRLEQIQLSQSDAAEMLGISRGRMSEFINGKRELPLVIIRRLHITLGIPLGSLVMRPNRVKERVK